MWEFLLLQPSTAVLPVLSSTSSQAMELARLRAEELCASGLFRAVSGTLPWANMTSPLPTKQKQVESRI